MSTQNLEISAKQFVDVCLTLPDELCLRDERREAATSFCIRQIRVLVGYDDVDWKKQRTIDAMQVEAHVIKAALVAAGKADELLYTNEHYLALLRAVCRFARYESDFADLLCHILFKTEDRKVAEALHKALSALANDWYLMVFWEEDPKRADFYSRVPEEKRQECFLQAAFAVEDWILKYLSWEEKKHKAAFSDLVDSIRQSATFYQDELGKRFPK